MAYVPASHQPGVEVEDDGHAAKVAAMFGGSHTNPGQPTPVKRNFTLPRRKSLVELMQATEMKEAAPPPPKKNIGVVSESVGVNAWKDKFASSGSGHELEIRRRRKSIDNLAMSSVVSGGSGMGNASSQSRSRAATTGARPGAKIYDPSTNVVSFTRPLQVVTGSAEARQPNGPAKAISFTSDGVVEQHHNNVPEPARPHPAMVKAPEHRRPSITSPTTSPVARTIVRGASFNVAKPKATPGKLGGGRSMHEAPAAAAAATPRPAFSKKPSKKWGGPTGPICPVCDRAVFKMEEVLIEGIHFHTWCCRCSIPECNKRLTAGNYASYKGSFYCKPCFMKCFKQKGNYDEGFGHKQRKLEWADSMSPEKAVGVGAETDM